MLCHPTYNGILVQDDVDHEEDGRGAGWWTNSSEVSGSRPNSWFGSESGVSEDSSLPQTTGSQSCSSGENEAGGDANESDPSSHLRSDSSGAGVSSGGAGSDSDIPRLISIYDDGGERAGHVHRSWEEVSDSSEGSVSEPPSLCSVCSGSDGSESMPRLRRVWADSGDSEASSGPPSLRSVASGSGEDGSDVHSHHSELVSGNRDLSRNATRLVGTSSTGHEPADADTDMPRLIPIDEERLVHVSDTAGTASYASLQPRSSLPVAQGGNQGVPSLTNGNGEAPIPEGTGADVSSYMHSVPSDDSLPSLVSEEDDGPCWQGLDGDQLNGSRPPTQSSSSVGKDGRALEDGQARWTSPTAGGFTEGISRRGLFITPSAY